MKSTLKRIVPASLRRVIRAIFGWRWFEGNFPTWDAARSACTGYDQEAIVSRVLAATLAVRDGNAAFERDGVTFREPVPEPELLASLASIAADAGRNVRLVDFGGALGTTFWRHRSSLTALGHWTWDIVEQSNFVSAGRRHLHDENVHFFESLDAAEAHGRHDVLLASTTLQYLATPHATLAEWGTRGFRWMLLNNLPLHHDRPDRIALQRVPPHIYPASYPVWFFNRDRLLACVLPAYEVVREFYSEAVWPIGWRDYPSTGLLLRRKSL